MYDFSEIPDSWSKAAAKLDMERMRTVVKRRILRALSDAENDPHSSIAGMALGDHLFGNNLDDVSFTKSSCYDRVVRNKLFEPKTLHGSLICSSSFRCSVLVYTLCVILLGENTNCTVRLGKLEGEGSLDCLSSIPVELSENSLQNLLYSSFCHLR